MPDKKKLAMVFGEQFVKEYTIALAKKRAEREKLTQDEAVAFVKAIGDGGFDPVNPKFGIEKNTALLLEMPENEDVIARMTRTLEGGAVSKGLLNAGEWISCLFNDPAMADKVEAGQFYIGIGRYYEQDRTEGGKFLNLQVKGIATLEEFQKMVDANNAGKKVDVTAFFR